MRPRQPGHRKQTAPFAPDQVYRCGPTDLKTALVEKRSGDRQAAEAGHPPRGFDTPKVELRETCRGKGTGRSYRIGHQPVLQIDRQKNRQFGPTGFDLNPGVLHDLTGKKTGKMLTTLYAIEPLVPEDRRQKLEDLATDLVDRAGRLAGRVHPIMQESLGDLVRAMNCYYSNLIEGHDTHPVDIDRALAGDFAHDRAQRNLQLEARAHIEVQQMIDRGQAPAPVVSVDFLLWVHREFCARLPDELLWVENRETGERLPVVPGAA